MIREDLARAICKPGIVSLIKRISRRRETMATTATNGDGDDADHRELTSSGGECRTTCRTKRRKRLTELTDVAADNKVATTLVLVGGEWRREDFKAEERDEITCGKERITIYLYAAISKIPSPFYRTIYVCTNYKYAVHMYSVIAIRC